MLKSFSTSTFHENARRQFPRHFCRDQNVRRNIFMPSHDVKNISNRTAVLFTKSAFFHVNARRMIKHSWKSVLRGKLNFLKSTYQSGPSAWKVATWYRPVYQPGTGRFTSLVPVGLPAWYLSGHEPGTCRDTSLVLVGTPAWYLSGYQPGTCRDTSLVLVGIPA